VSSNNIEIFKSFSSDRIVLHEMVWASKSIIHRTLWEWVVLPFFLYKNKVDIYYAPGGIMTTKMPNGTTSVTALRNMLPFNNRERQRYPLISYIRFKLWLLRYVYLKSYKMADKVIFISEHSKLVIKDIIPDIDEKSIVIHHGISNFFINSKESYNLPKYLKENKFYLYVSILDVYKAQKEMIQAWKILYDQGFEYPLVLVGPKYNKYGEEVVELINKLKLQRIVYYLGEVDYEKLPALYKVSRVLIFASSCECCPNILLEKMAAGKLILCSNIEPMPEFSEDAVVYFNPYNPNTLVDTIRLVEENQQKLKLFARKAKRQALKFNWDETTYKTINFLLN
jgi:glycosyltransferase involved in cell wall biosynthesis